MSLLASGAFAFASDPVVTRHSSFLVGLHCSYNEDEESHEASKSSH